MFLCERFGMFCQDPSNVYVVLGAIAVAFVVIVVIPVMYQSRKTSNFDKKRDKVRKEREKSGK